MSKLIDKITDLQDEKFYDVLIIFHSFYVVSPKGMAMLEAPDKTKKYVAKDTENHRVSQRE